MKHLFTYFLLLICFVSSAHDFIIEVFDSVYQSPVLNAQVKIEGTSVFAYTDANGQAILSKNQIETISQELNFPVFRNSGSMLSFSHSTASKATVYDALGSIKHSDLSLVHQIDFMGFESGLYLVLFEHAGKKYVLKLFFTQGKILCSPDFLFSKQNLSMVIEKDGFESKSLNSSFENISPVLLAPSQFTNEDYLTSIDTEEQFEWIEAEPLNPYFGEVTSCKFIYEIETGKIYYVNAKRYNAHSIFAMEVLNYPKSNNEFNLEQYANNPKRIYFPGTIDFFRASHRFVIQFFASDDISCEDINLVFEKIKQSCFFGDKLVFYANTLRTQQCADMLQVTSNELFNGQNYQCLNPEENFGYLRKVEFGKIESATIGRHDIVLTNGIPIDIPVVSGIITTEFQTPLSHINVLSTNRKTPNMVLRDGWTNTELLKFENKLIYLKTDFENYVIREATMDEAMSFWNSRMPEALLIPQPDLETSGLIELPDLSMGMANVVGAKAANFGELEKIDGTNGKVPLPEGAFAIPFFYYNQHLHENKIDTYITNLLSNNQFKTDLTFRKLKLEELRNLIVDAPINNTLKQLVENRIGLNEYQRTRFRSSTNAEDLDGFNGAGLYRSKTGIPGDENKSVEEAIKKVWASLWNFRACEEREYFRIDHRKVVMGVLAHRSFPDEEANGVLITKNIYRDGLPAFTINCQFDEISVVNPENGWQPEQILYYTFPSAENNPINYIHYSNVEGYENRRVLSENELHQLYRHCNDIIKRFVLKGIYKPLEIEFKIDKDHQGNRKLYIKQSRIFND